MRLTEVRVSTGDQGASFRFWREVMGLEPSFGEETSEYAAFSAGRDQVSVALFGRKHMAEAIGGQDPGGVVLSFEVADVDEAAARLRARGATLVAEPTDRPEWGNLRSAHLRDPDGNLVELFSKMPEPAG